MAKILYPGFLFLTVLIFASMLLYPGALMAQQSAPPGDAPISQPLVREGDLAVDLVQALGLGTAADETEAESTLGAMGITPKNGWIADYPVTPDISGELQDSIGAASDSGKLPMGRDQALAAFQNVLAGVDLPVKAAGGGQAAEASPENYSDAAAESDYYSSEGPPVVTYYEPPADYAYLYTWVPYPFWWENLWYPGFFVLADFDFVVLPGRFHHHGHRAFISNHFRDLTTGRTVRIDPTNRAQGGVFASAPARGAGTQAFRGYGVTNPSPGTGSSAFERQGTSSFEGAASTRGFQSRVRAGQLPAGRAASGGSRGGGEVSGFHGSGGRSGGGGGGRR